MKNPILIVLIALFFSCSKNDSIGLEQPEEIETIKIPSSSINYNSLDNWAFHPNKTTILSNYNLDIDVIDENLQVEQTIQITNNSNTNTGIDVFWVHPTQITDNSFIGNVDIADQPSTIISLTILAQGGLLSRYGRMYAPRYRQSTGLVYRDENIDKELQANIIAISYSDVKAAFLDYLNNHNNGNKIILAGHSQGSYLLGMLLRDLFDNDANLRSKLVTAALGGMGYVYAQEGEYKGGWWKNIPLCTTTNECGCINNWASFDEEQEFIDINFSLPEFNPYLINSGLVYRAFDENQDWFVQDFSYYGETSTPLENYITPNANYNLGNGANFIAFNGLYNVRLKRDGVQKVVLSVDHNPLINDQRPNDLESEQNSPNYVDLGYHTKDYHIYIWSLMQQIDEKLNNCQ
ncbi:DUF3089 domain-containing protein [Maribacter confluentis]|uniref:DUF3089 domain-containing protein n=1 Tax=Maribacter confluentis TaxID=1656093 RepID=A0ABT8RPQ4_9FLAO|nr:DUF3089 domain-containing protein [Maribacter confluentis]MDO1512387.1 DUF3089 domain-containing protein [Maribacter confluentis]